MRYIFLIILMAFSTVLVNVFCSDKASEKKEKLKSNETRHSVKKSGIELVVLSLKKGSWGEININMTITNISNEPITYATASKLNGFRFALFDKKGEALKISKNGEKYLNGIDEFKYSYVKLLPKKSLTSGSILLSDYFEKPTPGSYSLKVSWYRDRVYNENEKIESLNIPIEIIEEKKK